MPDSVTVQLADAIVATLNRANLPTAPPRPSVRPQPSSGFSQTFTATRGYAPIFDLKDMGTLHVTVVPKTIASELVTRGKQSEESYEIFIAVQKRITLATNSTIDALARLTEEIKEYFEGQAIIALSELNTRCTAATIDLVADWDYLMTKSQFLSLVNLTIFVFK